MGTKWLTAEDEKRIEDFLEKPVYERTIDDLVPDDDGQTDRT